jgi:hypothetical protein
MGIFIFSINVCKWMGIDPYTPIQGQFINAFIHQSISLQVPLDFVAHLPLEQWHVEWFDACNPRAMLPIKQLMALIQGTRGFRGVKRWTQFMNNTHNPLLDDEKRDVASNKTLAALLESGYVWLPALAWIIHQLPWDVVLELCSQSFGRSKSTGHAFAAPASARYREIELAIMKENLFRHLSQIHDLLEHVFGDQPSAFHTEHRAMIEKHIVRLTRMLVDPRDGRGHRGDVNVAKVIEYGHLAHIVKLQAQRTNALQPIILRLLPYTTLPWIVRLASW